MVSLSVTAVSRSCFSMEGLGVGEREVQVRYAEDALTYISGAPAGLKEVETQDTLCGEATSHNKVSMKTTLVQLKKKHCQTEQVKRLTILGRETRV